MLTNYNTLKGLKALLIITLLLSVLILFLPWTQTIRSKGYITTLKPNQRPQTVQSVIGGRIEKWYVQEGDFVNKGDTVMFLSETKDDYFDPNLLSRTEAQIASKEQSVGAYMANVKALDRQADALVATKRLKLQQGQNYIMQARLAIQSDSMDVQAVTLQNETAQNQLKRMEELYEKGLKSLTELEAGRVKLQDMHAKSITIENKLLESRNKLINAQVELGSIDNQYRDKLSKIESDKFAALSAMYDAEVVVTKMQNQYMNYSVRTGLYYITSPQDGYITRTLQSGLGETVKEGAELVSIMPAKIDIAVSIFVEPMDLPLVKKGQAVRFIFDGWPTIAFSGWPELSYGTFGGRVYAIDNFISENGKYRVLVQPDEQDKPWPSALRVGSGANAMSLLQDVSIWYELWRQLNGFPPDYYHTSTPSISEQK
tara:strand:+ start:2363 stop:3646 length:1284 start_codon:yes stop_codon:yes gene_type:complete